MGSVAGAAVDMTRQLQSLPAARKLCDSLLTIPSPGGSFFQAAISMELAVMAPDTIPRIQRLFEVGTCLAYVGHAECAKNGTHVTLISYTPALQVPASSCAHGRGAVLLLHELHLALGRTMAYLQHMTIAAGCFCVHVHSKL